MNTNRLCTYDMHHTPRTGSGINLYNMKDRIAQTARVTEVFGGRARVRLEGGETCRKCGLAAMGLCKPGGTGMGYEVVNAKGAKRGDRVRLGLDSRVHLKGYLFAYMLPLFSFVAGSIGGWALSNYSGINGLEVLTGTSALIVSIVFSLRKLRALDRTETMYVERIVHEVPDFKLNPETGPEGYDYLRAFTRGLS